MFLNVKNRKKKLRRTSASQTWIICFIFLLFLIACQPEKPSEKPSYEEQAISENLVTASSDVKKSSMVAIKERGVLRVGTAITDPFEYYDPKSGELIGFDVDLMNRIAEDLNVRIEWTEMSFAGLLPSVQDRKVDVAIAAIYINPDREAEVDFSEPYIYTGLVMIVRPDLVSSVKSVEDLPGLRVGVKIGATGSVLAQDLFVRGTRFEVIDYRDTLSSLLDLEVGRVDVVFNDYLNTLAYIKDAKSDLKIVTKMDGEVYFLSNVGLGIAVHEGEYELLSFINQTLDRMRMKGELDCLSEKWINPAIKD